MAKKDYIALSIEVVQMFDVIMLSNNAMNALDVIGKDLTSGEWGL